MTWLGFTAVFALFFATHSVPLRPRVRATLEHYLGPRVFTLAYSSLSLVMLAATIMSAGHAPYVQLWPQAIWQHYTVIAGMFVFCLILAFSLGRPNPFSFGGTQNDLFDPAQPGIVGWLRHPILAALTLWASLHLLPNGNLAHVLLFGVFTIFAVLGSPLIDRRKKREMKIETWDRLQSEIRSSSRMPSTALCAEFFKRLAGAIALFVILILLHPVLIGVSVL
mgnify:CR=1 FL=1